MANRSIEIVVEQGKLTATLALQHGKILQAKCGSHTGDTAAIETLLLEVGQFRILPLRKVPPTNVTMSSDNLILQSCYEKDVCAHARATDADQR